MINISDISRGSVLGLALRWPLRLIPRRAVVRILQGRMRGHRWIVGASTHGCWLGSYEAQKQTRFADALAPGDVVLDIGANVGFYTLLAAHCAGEAGRVIAIEPNPRNLEYLERHVALNGLGQVEIIRAAVGAADGTAQFDDSTEPSMGHLSPSGNIVVSVRSLDSLKRELRFGRVALMKIDVEGAELQVLQGGAELLKTDGPMIFLAAHGDAVAKECLDLLEQLGYVVEPLEPGQMAPDEFVAVVRASSAMTGEHGIEAAADRGECR